MSDTFITVIAIMVAAVLIFVVPLMTMADNFDTTSKEEVESIVSDFVDEVRSTRQITEENYDKFKENLDATGYKFSPEIEVKVLDENPGKKTLQTAKDKIGENVYYSEYTTQIEEELRANGKKTLSKGDIVKVDVKNTNTTLAQQLKKTAYKIIGSNDATIVASKAGMVQ